MYAERVSTSNVVSCSPTSVFSPIWTPMLPVSLLVGNGRSFPLAVTIFVPTSIMGPNATMISMSRPKPSGMR